ncbi:hypothetical protein [Phaeobacter gallaeciensis]|jgi:hypothetical protein|uniref:hypothetical protein n=1 Tax=Phaeobacter gallaeciensis TaxID=60890 RepID=UPI00237EEFC7|nr:hypothetical protein [Phaeobacter gallaeciensis]MDE4119431.1 hypothetical protein [Phaeobacter gallaeciensis]MDE4152527.1 hypothetical protein [Phaeobacter gallaeciensis]MDE4256991.1 hypothetical protein [Phaeobacter gallaeciensis]
MFARFLPEGKGGAQGLRLDAAKIAGKSKSHFCDGKIGLRRFFYASGSTGLPPIKGKMT